MKEKECKLTKKRMLEIFGVTAIAVAAYIIGCKYTSACHSRGLEQLWEADPTLKDHMWDSLAKYCKESK